MSPGNLLNKIRNLKNSRSERIYLRYLDKESYNIGHSLIRKGFEEISKTKAEFVSHFITETPNTFLDKKTVRLSTSLFIEKNHEFMQFQESKHFYESLKLPIGKSLELGLGVNGILGEEVSQLGLSEFLATYLNLLRHHEILIGARGKITKDFLQKNGLNPENILITSCPSVQLIKSAPAEIDEMNKRLIISGALLADEGYMSDIVSKNYELLVIPQSIDEYENARKASEKIKVLKVFLPGNYKEWKYGIQSWSPGLVIGTRLHGAILALSLGFPAVIMSGDLRTAEICGDSQLPHVPDICSLEVATDIYHNTNWSEFESAKNCYRENINILLNK